MKLQDCGHLALCSCLTLRAKHNVNMFGWIEGLHAKALCSVMQCCPAWQLVWCVIVSHVASFPLTCGTIVGNIQWHYLLHIEYMNTCLLLNDSTCTTVDIVSASDSQSQLERSDTQPTESGEIISVIVLMIVPLLSRRTAVNFACTCRKSVSCCR